MLLRNGISWTRSTFTRKKDGFSGETHSQAALGMVCIYYSLIYLPLVIILMD